MKNNKHKSNSKLIINENAHICTLSPLLQRKIERQLRLCGYFDEDIEMVMSSRIRDLEDSIDIMEVVA